MALRDDIKKSMRIQHTALDDVIDNDISAGTLDLVRVGVQPYQKDSEGEYVLVNGEKVLKEDALINKSLELYTKGQEDYEGKGEKYTLAYDKLRDSMSLCGDYNA